MARTDPQERNRLLTLLVLALLIRGVFAYVGFDSFQRDSDAYRSIAETLSSTGVFGLSKPTAFRPPLYPYLLSWLTPGDKLSLSAVAVLHVLLGTATVLLTTLVCSRLIDANRIGRASVFAGVLVAIDPILLQQSNQIMTETIATTLSMAVIWWWTRWTDLSTSGSERTVSADWKSCLVLSVLLALAYLCRPTFLVWAGLLAFATVFVGTESVRDAFANFVWRNRVMNGFLVGSLVAVAMFGWTLRNQRSIGHPVWATSHGGYTLLLANNPSFYDYLRNGQWGEAWDATQFLNAYQYRWDDDPNDASFWRKEWPVQRATTRIVLQPISEHEDDQRCYLAARATIDRQPAMFVWSCVVRCGRLWSPIPHHTPGRSWTKIICVSAFYTAIYGAMFVTLWRLRRVVFGSRWWSILALALTLSTVHSVYWSNLRMRAPIIPVISLLAAGVLADRRELLSTRNRGDC